ncbi:Fic/DOC family protein [Croceitalea dokdonensis DOKDO 023]|uniref:Fic/DOC family protein n=1 Tax=Croceitalea dokdonensis DOKDO 023 TaxID=1300341 RepID=A0A0N8H3Y8_9FLAO|nr:RhuM family protein [Croceitalea dokdonensis]KPM31892.1 Fic/DOC family protein [Croceitalea dokdonensis DOKDO 023]
MNKDNQIVIYQSDDGKSELQVSLQDDTVWLTQAQIVKVFNSSKANISEHIKNIFGSGELSEEATVRNFRTVQQEGNRNVTRNRIHYNLDVIISVGYRVNSKRGTQFRIWANSVLKNYLVEGYAINEKRLQQKTAQLESLKKVVALQEQVLTDYALNTNETQGLIHVISQYSKALDILDDYDHQRLKIPESKHLEVFKIGYTEARKAIDALGRQTKFEGLFGKEKDDSFKGSLDTIYQTFDGKDLYSSIEEKAAHLLYFVVKNHSFTDGNKRIAAFLFVWFLERNKILLNQKGFRRINENTLVALTLMIAESHPEDKDMMVKVVVNLLIAEE